MTHQQYTRVGIFSTAILFFSFFGYLFISKKGVFDNSTKLYIFTQEAYGLKRESPVLSHGFKIGKISDLDLEEGKVLVELSIDQEIKIPKSTKFYSELAGAFGGRQINVQIEADENVFYKNGDTVAAFLNYEQMNSLIDSSFFKELEPSIKELSNSVGQALIDYSESIDTTKIEIKEK